MTFKMVCAAVITLAAIVNFIESHVTSDKVRGKLCSIAGTADLIFAWLILHG